MKHWREINDKYRLFPNGEHLVQIAHIVQIVLLIGITIAMVVVLYGVR